MTTCPFCGGRASLMSADSELTDAALVEQFRGLRTSCMHADCERPYAIRREDLKIRRE
jgi:hypothetical protein